MTSSCTEKQVVMYVMAKWHKAFSILQDLQNLAGNHTLSADVKHDVAADGADLSTAYTVTSYADLQDYQGLTCSVLLNSTLNSLIKTCASLNNGACCVDYGRLSSTMVRPGAL